MNDKLKFTLAPGTTSVDVYREKSTGGTEKDRTTFGRFPEADCVEIERHPWLLTTQSHDVLPLPKRNGEILAIDFLG